MSDDEIIRFLKDQNQKQIEQIPKLSLETLKEIWVDTVSLLPRNAGWECGRDWAVDPDNKDLLEQLVAAVRASGQNGREGDAADLARLMPVPKTAIAWVRLAETVPGDCLREMYGDRFEEDICEAFGITTPEDEDGNEIPLINNQNRKEYILGFLQSAMEVWHWPAEFRTRVRQVLLNLKGGKPKQTERDGPASGGFWLLDEKTCESVLNDAHDSLREIPLPSLQRCWYHPKTKSVFVDGESIHEDDMIEILKQLGVKG